MIKQLAHICINSDNLVATEHFYCKALGLEKGFEFIRNEKLFGFYLKFGERSFIEVFEGAPGDLGNIDHFAVEVEDMDSLLKRVTDCGYAIEAKKLGVDNSWQSWLTDPNGVKIELHEYTDKSLQLIGGSCVVDW